VSERTAFSYIKAINDGKDILKDSIDESEYVPFLTNLAFSLYKDTILQANDMNCRPWLPARMQNRYLLSTISPKKRWKPWPKKPKVSIDNLRLIQDHYKYNDTRAKEALSVLSEEQIKWIQEKQEKGG